MEVDPVRLYLHVRIQFVNPHYRPGIDSERNRYFWRIRPIEVRDREPINIDDLSEEDIHQIVSDYIFHQYQERPDYLAPTNGEYELWRISEREEDQNNPYDFDRTLRVHGKGGTEKKPSVPLQDKVMNYMNCIYDINKISLLGDFSKLMEEIDKTVNESEQLKTKMDDLIPTAKEKQKVRFEELKKRKKEIIVQMENI